MENSVMYIVLTDFNPKFRKRLTSSKIMQMGLSKPYTIYQVDMTYLQQTKPSEEDLNRMVSHIQYARTFDENVLIFFVGNKFHYDEIYKDMINQFNYDASISYIFES